MQQITHLGDRTVISQDRNAYTGTSHQKYLIALLQVVSAIEQVTQHRWRLTSFIRQSPNHKTACALDIAPDIAAQDAHAYAVTRGSDPVLYKRAPLVRQLQRVCREFVHDNYDVGIFIEPDHLHLQLFTPSSPTVMKVFKWKGPKQVYADTLERMVLPVTETGYPC